MNYLFRPARMQELDEVAAFFKRAIAHMKTQGIEQWDEVYPSASDLLTDIQRGELYVLLHDTAIASAVVLNEEQDADYRFAEWTDTTGRPAVIHRLCVHPHFQGMGVGHKTMLLAHEHLIRLGYSSVRLDTFEKNPQALALYERLGYHRTGQACWRKGRFFLYEKLLCTYRGTSGQQKQ
ncbi:MAG: GNAT family N-acetyltransferase [Acetanaerobacterium sp.]